MERYFSFEHAIPSPFAVRLAFCRLISRSYQKNAECQGTAWLLEAWGIGVKDAIDSKLCLGSCVSLRPTGAAWVREETEKVDVVRIDRLAPLKTGETPMAPNKRAVQCRLVFLPHMYASGLATWKSLFLVMTTFITAYNSMNRAKPSLEIFKGMVMDRRKASFHRQPLLHVLSRRDRINLNEKGERGALLCSPAAASPQYLGRKRPQCRASRAIPILPLASL
ncbi:hypothetical protein BDP55DRAFT_80371 [Colletotrichum godetiae]|uniref:Uncharacterized protein n=1 Tax=Colletotrichum godetiae TaxID=1209918 RepID=A0AAJ0EPN6_9PEZI|nr:uncharacterized protein BDP55DRAFT_80371 [Colletotrichum godetiae]KAK1656658.1 hypothetical protein BDP55DRAFT_80371 [Colletotrichum godetiae]